MRAVPVHCMRVPQTRLVVYHNGVPFASLTGTPYLWGLCVNMQALNPFLVIFLFKL